MEESARRRTGAFRAGWNWLGLALSGLLMLAASPALAQDAAGGRPSASGMATPLFSAPWGDEAVSADGSRAAEDDTPPVQRVARLAPTLTVSDQARAIDCMTAAIAYEAGYEPLAGREAVAQVILNRLREPRFPKTVCGVVFEGSQRRTGCQFTFTCDGSLMRRLRSEVLEAARATAVSVLAGAVPDHVRGATHYHANYVNPYWAATGQMTAQIGAHLFYRMPADAARIASGPVYTRGESGLVMNVLAPAMPAAGRVRLRGGAAQQGAAPARLFAPWGLAMSNAGTGTGTGNAAGEATP